MTKFPFIYASSPAKLKVKCFWDKSFFCVRVLYIGPAIDVRRASINKLSIRIKCFPAPHDVVFHDNELFFLLIFPFEHAREKRGKNRESQVFYRKSLPFTREKNISKAPRSRDEWGRTRRVYFWKGTVYTAYIYLGEEIVTDLWPC